MNLETLKNSELPNKCHRQANGAPSPVTPKPLKIKAFSESDGYQEPAECISRLPVQTLAQSIEALDKTMASLNSLVSTQSSLASSHQFDRKLAAEYHGLDQDEDYVKIDGSHQSQNFIGTADMDPNTIISANLDINKALKNLATKGYLKNTVPSDEEAFFSKAIAENKNSDELMRHFELAKPKNKAAYERELGNPKKLSGWFGKAGRSQKAKKILRQTLEQNESWALIESLTHSTRSPLEKSAALEIAKTGSASLRNFQDIVNVARKIDQGNFLTQEFLPIVKQSAEAGNMGALAYYLHEINSDEALEDFATTLTQNSDKNLQNLGNFLKSHKN